MKSIIYNPFNDKLTKMDPYGTLAKRIYRYYIKDKGIDPENIIPSDLNYNAETNRFTRIKTKQDNQGVKRIHYSTIKVLRDNDKFSEWSYFYNLFKKYKGKTIRVAKQYTYDGILQDSSEIIDIPNNGYGGWWNGFSFFFMIDSETGIFDASINDGLESKFQTQVLIFTMNKVQPSNYTQYFMEGITNCLLKPIREWGVECLDEAKSKTAQGRYKKIIRECDKFEEKFQEDGVPEHCISEICEKLQIGIEIDLPSTANTKTKYIDGRSQKKPIKIFKYINTRLNHIDLNEVRSLNNYEEVSQERLNEIFQNGLEEGMTLWKQAKTGITQVHALDKIYKLNSEEGFRRAVKEFEEKNDIDQYKLEYYNNPELSNFLKDNFLPNKSLLFCSEQEYEDMDEDLVNHIDMSKSYTRAEFCKFYEGYLGKVTDFRKTDKIIGLGIYQVDNIKYNGNDIIEKLKVFHNGNAYPSPELKYYKSLGIDFDIVGGCWGSSFDIEFTGDPEKKTGMYEKEAGVSHYCKWYGTLIPMEFYARYNFDCKDLEYAKLNSQFSGDSNIRYHNQWNVGLIEYKKRNVFHRLHIASFITSYARINLMEQLLKIKIGDIIAVQVDGIYYQGEVELDELFDSKDKNTCAWIQDTEYTINNENKIYEFPEYREHNRIEIHTGAGGCGKTHKNLVDKGLCGVMYIAPSWKLARNKESEYKCNVTVYKRLLNDNPDVWRLFKNNYSTLIIDEISMMNNKEKKEIIQRYPNHKIIFCGDIGFQLPPIEGFEFDVENYPVIEHTNNRRCKCPKLQKILDYLREELRLKKYYNHPLFHEFRKGTLFDINIRSRTNIDYDTQDLIISTTNRLKDLYTAMFAPKSELEKIINSWKKKLKNKSKYMLQLQEDSLNEKIKLYNTFMNIEDKPELEKYVVTVNTLNHSNGEIVFEKIPNAGCEIRHGFTVHSIQGETATNKLYIDVTGIRDLRMLYTALSRAQYLDQIILIN